MARSFHCKDPPIDVANYRIALRCPLYIYYIILHISLKFASLKILQKMAGRFLIFPGHRENSCLRSKRQRLKQNCGALPHIPQGIFLSPLTLLIFFLKVVEIGFRSLMPALLVYAFMASAPAAASAR
jgi:hypothetical protein